MIHLLSRHLCWIVPRGPATARIALLLLSALLSGGSARELESVLGSEPPELAKRLRETGLVVLEDVATAERTSFVIAYVLFEQPRERVMALLTNGPRQVEWRPDLNRVETIEKSSDGRVDEIEMRVLFRALRYRVAYRLPPGTDRIEWKLDPRFENDLRRFEGFWEFSELEGGQTLARFGTLVDAGAVFPAFMQRELTRRSVVDTMESCKRWVDSNGEGES